MNGPHPGSRFAPVCVLVVLLAGCALFRKEPAREPSTDNTNGTSAARTSAAAPSAAAPAPSAAVPASSAAVPASSTAAATQIPTPPGSAPAATAAASAPPASSRAATAVASVPPTAPPAATVVGSPRAPAASGAPASAYRLKAVGATKGSAGGVGGGNGATAREIPDGSDDDIIARRLRKAAEQEGDPVLRQKLWSEYLSYRGNVRAN